MRIVSVFCVSVLTAPLSLPVLAGSLNKYMDESPAPVYQQQFSPETIKDRLNQKMSRAIAILNAMEGEEKERWIREYKKKQQQALASGNHLEAAYYRGILEQVEKPVE